MKKFITNYMNETYAMQNTMLNDENLISTVEEISNLMVDCYKKGNKVLLAGNGGSAGDAQHIAGELVNKFFIDRKGLAGIALSTDTSVMTAVGNDYSFDDVFKKQIEAIGKEGDIFIGISTSGNSKDIVKGLEICKEMGIKTVGLTGEKESKMSELCDITLKIPSTCTPHVQEGHIVCYHMICALVEDAIFGKNK